MPQAGKLLSQPSRGAPNGRTERLEIGAWRHASLPCRVAPMPPLIQVKTERALTPFLTADLAGHLHKSLNWPIGVAPVTLGASLVGMASPPTGTKPLPSAKAAERGGGRGGAAATPPGPGRLLSHAQLLGGHRRAFDPRRDLLERNVARHVWRAVLRLDVDAERREAAIIGGA
jgi:hypothetical protein